MPSIQPSVLIRDEYGNERTVYPPGWMYVLAFAIAGHQWAIDEIKSGRCDAAMSGYLDEFYELTHEFTLLTEEQFDPNDIGPTEELGGES